MYWGTYAKGTGHLQKTLYGRLARGGGTLGSGEMELGEVDRAGHRGLRSAKELGLYPEGSGEPLVDFKE